MSWSVSRVSKGWVIMDEKGERVFVPENFGNDSQFIASFLATAPRVAKELVNILGSTSAIMTGEFVRQIVIELGRIYEEEMSGQEMQVSQEERKVGETHH